MSDNYGLSHNEASIRLKQYGANKLPEHAPPSQWSVFIAQLRNPLVYILIGAGIVTTILQHYSDTAIIAVSILINTVLGYLQEKKANQAFTALKQFVTTTAVVIREGIRFHISTEELVPGDVVFLSQGSKVPADGTVTFANRVFFDEALITGESIPAAKNTKDPVFMGTTVASGQATMVITSTGSKTRIGGIATNIQKVEEDTPLKRQLTDFSKKIIYLVISLIFIVFLVGLLRGKELVELFTTAVALAVSSIPEGLIVSLTVILAIGMQKILKRQGLVRKLASAETLGGVTTICLDKTGTLTAGKMQVVSHHGKLEDLYHQALLANDLDDPIVIAAFQWAEQHHEKGIIDQFPRIDSIPFSPKERFFISLHDLSEEKNCIYVNGAPDVLLEWTLLSQQEKKALIEKIDTLSSQGKRVIGFAKKEVAKTKTSLTHADAKSDLEWVGMLAFFDPVRPSVRDALTLAQAAGIKLMVITGDYPKTTQFVLKEIGLSIPDNKIMLGEELEKLSLEELTKKIASIQLFARTTPDHKHRIVQALKENGEVVAMMGDGVNDAPAIHAADIGIVVNEASDVSKESADLVLLDSNFSTVIAAIEEGRAIFNNSRKIILYLLSDAFAEIFVVLVSIGLGLPLPITAIQIIWINLVSDGFPGLALTVDPHSAAIMKESPRPSSEKLINRWMIVLITMVSSVAGLMALTVFMIVYFQTNDLALARSMTFATLGLNSLAYVFSVRSLLVPFWRTSMLENKWLIISIIAGGVLQYIPFSTNATRSFFGVVELPSHYWLAAVTLSIIVFVCVELFKPLGRYILKHPAASVRRVNSENT